MTGWTRRRRAALFFAALAPVLAVSAAAQARERFACTIVSLVKCSPTGHCRTDPPNEGEKSLVFALDFAARTLVLRQADTVLATLAIHHVKTEGAKRMFAVERQGAPPPPADWRPYVLEGRTMTLASDTSGSSTRFACDPAP